MMKKKKNENDIYVIKKDICYGCMACYNICPNEAIYIIEDEEGFYFPAIDIKKCVHCNQCRERCPSVHGECKYNKETKEREEIRKGYIAQNLDIDVRISSTSGGVFGALASWCVSHDGVVFGAMIDESLRVIHSFSDNIEDCTKFRGSKYVQSNIENSYTEVKKFLEQNRYVLFSGTPCQIEGLLKFLGMQYDKLITVDVVCRGVLSPGVFRNYLDFQKQSLKRSITNIKFREKRWGYKYTALALYSSNECIYAKGPESDALLRAFFENNYDRLSCYHCQFKKQYRKSDITIWDCFNANLYNKEFDDDKGTNKVLVHTQNGRKLIEELGMSNELLLCEIPVKQLISENTEEMFESIFLNKDKRELFFNDYLKVEPDALWKKYYPDSSGIKIRRFIRKFLYYAGIYQRVRRMKNRMIK